MDNVEDVTEVMYCPVCKKKTVFTGKVKIIPDSYNEPGYEEGYLECSECGEQIEI